MVLPSTDNNPHRAILVAIIFSSLIHGFAHSGINPIGIVIGSFIYGIPPALLYLKRDFEHAIGFHFLIDFIRFGCAYFLI
ncbi:MAG: type II CAAX prenyl endopeptidase Rce1 family protein [Candidatus Hodarchaeota archaeon]